MPRRAKGPRLWLRPPRHDAAGRLTHAAVWCILDGASQRSTGFGTGELDAAEKALAAYLEQKHTKTVTTGTRDPSQILIDDVLALYVREKASSHARPEETKSRIQTLRKFWGGRALSEVTGATCRAYAAARGGKQVARRELEEFRAAINYHRRENLHDKIVSVVLPEKSDPRERWLTRDEAAALIRSAWSYREIQNLRSTDRHTRRHVARWMVTARYMGSRAAVICTASIEPTRPEGRPWVDLKRGVFYGRPRGQRLTNKRRQTVRVPAPLLAHMRRWQRQGQRYVVEWNGEPVSRINKAHAAVVAAVGLDDVTPHTWRHTVATWLSQGGADPVKAADFLAMSPETFFRVYRHNHPDDSAEVHAALSRQRTAKDMSEQKAILTPRVTSKTSENPPFPA